MTVTEKTSTDTAKVRYYRTGITSLDDLLLPFKKSDPADADSTGLAFHSGNGFFGTVFGVAGSGKSILALQLAAICGNGDDGNNENKRAYPSILDAKGDKVKDMKFSGVYVTQESVMLMKEKIASFGWIDADRIHLPGNPKFLNLAEGGLHLAQFDLNEDSQAGVLRNIFHAVDRGTDEGDDHFTLVCFDNAETILPVAYSELVGTTPDDRNFYKSIRDFCRKRKLHLMMFFEERVSDAEGGQSAVASDVVATTSQAYAADLVIRLGSNVFPSGYKERSLEIVKAKNQYHRRGTHHFSIISGGNVPAGLKSGLVIYESLATQLYKLRYPQRSSETKCIDIDRSSYGNFGIKTLDERIGGLSGTKVNEGFLAPASVSVLVCDLDVRPIEIALHFAYRPQDRDREVSSENEDLPKDAVYISFLNPWESLRKVLNPFFEKELSVKRPKGFLHFEPEHISEGKLLQDIRIHIEEAQKRIQNDENANQSPLRVVVDNLYALEAKYPLIQNTAHFITAMFALFRNLNVIAVVLDTIEVGVGTNPLDKSFAAGLGQNVFLLRHVELHSRSHTAFSVVQLLNKRTRETLWEVVDDEGELRVLDTFRYYKNVLSGRAEFVTVRMSLHADERHSPLDQYFRAKMRAMKGSLGQTLKLECYRPESYAHMHGAISLARQQPLSECHVISIDETWLEDLLLGDDLEELSESVRYTGATTTCHDLALYYLDKESRSNSHNLTGMYAIPDRNNCGVLMVADVDLLRESSILDREIQNNLKAFIKNSKKTWDDLLSLKTSFYEAEASVQTSKKAGEVDLPFFTFCRDQAESCVSFMLELAVACIPKRQTLVGKNRTLTFHSNSSGGKQLAWKTALYRFVRLLDSRDKEEIAEGMFRPSSEEPPSIFSRQWFNTCMVLRNRKGEDGHSLFSTIRIYELPHGNRGCPAVVSGAWYFGILKGSAAVQAGVEAISQFTSPDNASTGEDLRKANLGIGLPVRGKYYGPGKQALELIHELPYRKRFYQISELDSQGEEGRVRRIAKSCDYEFPFYRMRIKHYRQIMPIIWGMMVTAARKCRKTRNGEFDLSITANKQIRQQAQKRYEALLKDQAAQVRR